MQKQILSIAILIVLCLRAAGGQADSTNDEASAKQLFAKFAGSWSCSGKFADGRPLASDIVMTLRMDGRSLRYEHRDRAPNNFVQEATWGPDAANHQLVSLAFAGNSQRLIPELFVAKSWSAASVTFEAETLTSPPFAPNRFTYSIDEGGALKMIWEVQRNGTWSQGDQIKCTRE